MLSPSGPTGGMVLSPLHGEIPGRIAVVQGHNQEDEDHIFSSLVLGVNESILALDKTEDLEVCLISPVCQSFQDQFLAEAKKIAGLMIIAGAPASVARNSEGEPLTLSYSENGEQKQETFDLIVVLTKPKISRELSALSRKLEQEIV
jgi:heterodisulfide reductase subunit A-like polyferredoxin